MLKISKKQEKKNEALANDIKDFLIENQLTQDVRIYFNNKCYDWNGDSYEDNKFKVIEGIQGSTFFEYANDETVSMSFEGVLYEVLNYAFTSKHLRQLEEFEQVFEKHGVYFELGHSWNLSVFE